MEIIQWLHVIDEGLFSQRGEGFCEVLLIAVGCISA